MNNKRVAIVATDYFEKEELLSPRDILLEHDVTVDVVAPKSGALQALHHVDLSTTVAVDHQLNEVNFDDYDALVISGGVVNSDHLRMDETAQEFVQAMMESEKPIAAICHGPWLLISAGIVLGHTLTSYYTLQDDIRNAGGEWINKEVVVDGNLITSRNPDDLPAFNSALLRAL